MRKLKRILLIILIVVLIGPMVLVILNFIPVAPFSYKSVNSFRKTDKYPIIIPHGGAKELAPENTIYSYDMLVNDFNAGVLEIDLALTKDGILMAHHDLDLEFSEASSMNGALIRDYTYQEIIDEYENDDYYLARNFVDARTNTKPFESSPKADLATMIPAKLGDDIFNIYGDTVLYILEIKDSPTSNYYEAGSDRYKLAANELLRLVKMYDLEKNVVLASFSDSVIGYFHEKAPDMMYNAGVDEVTKFAVYSAFYFDFFWRTRSQVLILPNRTSMEPITGKTADLLDKVPKFFSKNIAIKTDAGYEPNLMNKRVIKAAHRKNMACFYWTINDPDEMRELIKLGADGIITDRPDLLKEIIDELKNAE